MRNISKLFPNEWYNYRKCSKINSNSMKKSQKFYQHPSATAAVACGLTTPWMPSHGVPSVSMGLETHCARSSTITWVRQPLSKNQTAKRCPLSCSCIASPWSTWRAIRSTSRSTISRKSTSFRRYWRSAKSITSKNRQRSRNWTTGSNTILRSFTSVDMVRRTTYSSRVKLVSR